jgi:hypothetical protein
MTLSHLNRLGLDDDAVRCQWWMEMMTGRHHHNRCACGTAEARHATGWRSDKHVCTVAGNRHFAQRLAAWIALSFPPGYVGRPGWVELGGFPVALLRREPYGSRRMGASRLDLEPFP